MAELLCKCGCGEKVYAASKSGFLRGHHMRGAADASTPPQQPEDQTAPTPEAEPETDYTQVSCPLSEAQLNRIWAMLPITEKAMAIIEALQAARE